MSTDWWSAGERWLEQEASKEAASQKRAWVKRGRSSKTFRYSPPEWHRDAVAALGRNDEETFKAIKLDQLGTRGLPPLAGRSDRAPKHHHSTKKSPAQLDREIAESLRGSRGEQGDVMIVARPKDWDLLEESIRLDVESSAFDSVLRWKIGEAMAALEVGTTYQGRGQKVVARARQKDWKLLEETLQADAPSKRLPKHEREDLQAALKRLVIKEWPH